MPVYQSFNKKNKSYVKLKKYGSKTTILNVKQKNPTVPFKGVKIKKK